MASHPDDDSGAASAPRARVRIRYCTQCRWLHRAAWLAQELLTTFPTEIEITLEPGFGGVFEVELEQSVIFSRAERRRFPEPKELKQKIRDLVAPGRLLGHSDEPAGLTTAGDPTGVAKGSE